MTVPLPFLSLDVLCAGLYTRHPYCFSHISGDRGQGAGPVHPQLVGRVREGRQLRPLLHPYTHFPGPLPLARQVVLILPLFPSIAPPRLGWACCASSYQGACQPTFFLSPHPPPSHPPPSTPSNQAGSAVLPPLGAARRRHHSSRGGFHVQRVVQAQQLPGLPCRRQSGHGRGTGQVSGWLLRGKDTRAPMMSW